MTATLEFRTAIFEALYGKIIYMGKVIPVYEEWVQETESNKISEVKIGNYDVNFFIILKSQTEDFSELGGKCRSAVDGSIQIQVKAVFPANTGGSKHAELVGKLVQSALFQNKELKIPITDSLQVSRGQIEGVFNINYNNETKHEWVHQMLITAQLIQKN